MDFIVIQFIRDTLKRRKSQLKDVVNEASIHFNIELASSDISFISIQYRNILMDFWADECLDILKEKIELNQLNDDDVLELLETFRNLDAFDETPEYLQGDFYMLIKNQREIFNPRNFINPRKEILEFLTFTIRSFGENAKQDCEFHLLLIDVLKNSYKYLDELINALDLRNFMNGGCSIFEVSRKVLENNFDIDGYNLLKDVSTKIKNQRTAIEKILRKKVKLYLDDVKLEQFWSGGLKILKFQKKICLSKNLNVKFPIDVHEIHVICDILHIDEDLPENYRGKNFLFVGNTIRLHKSSIWDFSGHDAVQNDSSNAFQFSNGDGKNGSDGKPGESGGNCEIFCSEIINSSNWILKSNGGNASNGQNGGNGLNGADGHDIKINDFKILGQKITKDNFVDLVSQLGISTSNGSRRKTFYENGLEKTLMFNRNSSNSELLMLIRGSNGNVGGLGGFGGFCGQGGFAGKINIHSDNKGYKINCVNGLDGKNGENGYNGKSGRDGSDAYMKISTKMSEPKFGGLNESKNYQILIPGMKNEFSIYNEIFKSYLSIEEVEDVVDPEVAVVNDENNQIVRLSTDERDFYDNLSTVLESANEKSHELIRKLEIQNFVDLRIDFKAFTTKIVQNYFDIKNYNNLQCHAKFFTLRDLKIESQIRELLKSFTADVEIINKYDNIFECKKQILKSSDLNLMNQNFEELHVSCDILHLNTNLSDKFRGRKLGIYANKIIIHKSVELSTSGIDSDGSNELSYLDGGDIFIDCNIIENASLLTLTSNGGNAVNLENGIDVQSQDFHVNGRSIEGFSSVKDTFNDGSFRKYLVKSENSSLLLVKGVDASRRRIGLAGRIFIKSDDISTKEMKIVAEKGKFGNFQDGRDAFVYFNDGTRREFGLNCRHKYELMESKFERENSVKYLGKFYFPKLSKIITKLYGIDDLEFYENLIWVLRNSYNKLDELVEKLKLKEFINNQISLSQVTEKISEENFNISNFSNLKNCAKNFKFPKFNQELIQTSIKDFIQPSIVSQESDKLIIKQKLFISSNLDSLSINSTIMEIQIFCDTLHIDSDLPKSFRGKNLAISANYVQVYKKVTWDLSGLEATLNDFTSKASRHYDGTGIDGDDGNAGNSGGNFSLVCKFIENSSSLTVVSNGSDGTKGQDGGDGKDGRDGKDAEQKSFILEDGTEWGIRAVWPTDILKLNVSLTVSDKTYSTTGKINGLKCAIYECTGLGKHYGFLLIYGSDGMPGKSGGLYGYGGQGGSAGMITIHIEQGHDSIIKVANTGKNGASGINGWNGKKGKDGRDLYKYDNKYFTSSEITGLDKNVKYDLNWYDESCDKPCTYVESKKQYVKPVERSIETYTKTQNSAILTRDRKFKAKSKKNAAINIKDVKKESSKFLTDNVLQKVEQNSSKFLIDVTSFKFSKTTQKNQQQKEFTQNLSKIEKVLSTYSDLELRMPSSRVESIQKSDILVESVINQYSDGIRSNTNDIDDVTRKYGVAANVETDESEVQSTVSVQIKFEANQMKTGIMKSQTGRVLFHELLQALIQKSNIKNILNLVRSSQIARINYESFIEKIKGKNIQIQPMKRRNINNPKIILKFLEKFIVESTEPNILKYYNLYRQNNANWKACAEDSKILYQLLTHVTKSQPNYLINFLKNAIKDTTIVVEDVLLVCKEKIEQKFYKEVYRKFSSESYQNEDNISYTSKQFPKQIKFLKDTKIFASHSEKLNKHFNNCGPDERKEVLQYFLVNINNFQFGLPEAIFNLLTDLAGQFKQISGVLKDFNKKMMKIHKDFANNMNVKKDKAFALIREFYTKKDVVKFIKNDIQSNGITSKIYRKILGYKYDVKIVILIEDMIKKLKILEDHNYPHDLWFDYGNQTESKEVFVLINNRNYSTLEFQKLTYESFQKRVNMEESFKNIVGSLNNKTDPPKLLKETIKNHKIKNHKFLQIFDVKNSWIDTEMLIDIILSNFPYKILKYDKNGVQEFTIDEITEENIAKIIINPSNDDPNPPHYEIDDDRKIRESIKLNLLMISNLDGSSILKAFAIRLHNDKNCQSLNEFAAIVLVMLDFLGDDESLSYLLTFLILGSEQTSWSFELILLKLEKKFKIFDKTVKDGWRFHAEKIKDPRIMQLFLDKILELENANENDLTEIFANVQHFKSNNFNSLKNTSLESWKMMTTEGYWINQIEKLKSRINQNDTKYDNLKEVFEDLSSKYGPNAKELIKILQNKKKELPSINVVSFVKNFTVGEIKLNQTVLTSLSTTHASKWNDIISIQTITDDSIRNAEKIVEIVKSDDEASPAVKNKIAEIGREARKIFDLVCPKTNKRFMEFTESEVMEWKNNLESPNVLECLAIVTRSFQILSNNKITLRDTQLMSILTMWHSQNGILMQVSTGEGKTFIGVSFAIIKVLHGEKVDIITSSSVLAVRDAEENKNVFDFFGISVDHNCYDDPEKRKKAYSSKVVYGILGNFQRDYLLTSFYNENFLSGHHFNNVLVDEVDSMLLDKGNNILYLSSELPDIDEVESVFVLIWYFVTQNSQTYEQIAELRNKPKVRCIMLDNIYGIISQEDIKRLNPDVDANAILQKLRYSEIVDNDNLIIAKNYDSLKFDSILEDIDSITKEKLKFLCKSKIETQRPIKVPAYLKKFVLIHLDKWIESAIRALSLRNEKEYIIDRINSEADPKIIVLDIDTGTDMTNSQWDEGLHQFLQLKHGCKLTRISLKSVFISNVSYFKKYAKLYGMTGTLGSLDERNKTTEIHKIDFVTLPRYIPQKFSEYPSILEKDPNKWIQRIHDEITEMFNKRRSVLVICETIQDTKIISKALLSNSLMFSNENVHVYQRDAKEFFKGKLQPKHVIVSTNLAGRGTDIKLSDQLKESGGLHVILSYLPQNKRIENQALGRASRAGDKGSGRVIMLTDSDQSISEMKDQRNKNEIQRLDEVNRYYKNFIKIEEKVFSEFHEAFKELKLHLQPKTRNKREVKNLSEAFLSSHKLYDAKEVTDIYLENFKVQFSFWLDENSVLLDKWKSNVDQDKISNSFNELLSQEINLHPTNLLNMFTTLMNNKEGTKAKELLNDDYENDLLASQYNKCYKILADSESFWTSGFPKRELNEYEEFELNKCIKMFDNRVHDLKVRMEIINVLKDNYQTSLVPIQEFHNQQAILNEINDIFIESLQSILGKDVTPDTLRSAEINLPIMTEELYQTLIDYKCITEPQLKYPKILNGSKLDDDDEVVRKIARDNKVAFADLKTFIMANPKISSLKNFEDDIKEKFKIPSREEFWSDLLSKKILSNEVEFLIINLNVLIDVDPSIYDAIHSKFSDEELKTNKNNEIFLVNIIHHIESEAKIRIKKSDFQSQISTERFKYLQENQVFEVNKRANFNIEKYEKFKNIKIFNNFDEIKKQDFKEICCDVDRILKKLTSNSQPILIKHDDDSYLLNYENLKLLDPASGTNIFSDDSVYQNAIIELILYKFSYRIALEKLVENVNSNSNNNLVISLELSPHLNLLNELISERILIPSKVNINNVDKTSKIPQTSLFSDTIKKVRTTHTSGISNEKTVNFLLHCANVVNDQLKNVENLLKSFIPAILNENLSEVIIRLKPIDDEIKDENQTAYLNFYKKKSLGHLIKVEQNKYTFIYFVKLVSIYALAAAQIVIGAIIFIKSAGTCKNIGWMLITQGIGDLIFASQTLFAGHFTYKDYWNYKWRKVVTSIGMLIAPMILPRASKVANYFGASKVALMFDKAANKISGTPALENAWNEICVSSMMNLSDGISSIFQGESVGVSFENILTKKNVDLCLSVVDTFKKDFDESDMSNLLGKILNHCDPNKVGKILVDEYKKLDKTSMHLTEIAKSIKNKADGILQDISEGKKLDFATVKEFGKFTVNQIAPDASISNVIKGTCEGLSGKLKSFLATKEDDELLFDLNETDKMEIIEKLKNMLSSELSENVKNVLANNAFNPLATSFGKTIVTKDKIDKSQMHNNDTSQILSIVKNDEEINEAEDDTNKLLEDTEKLKFEVFKNTKDPKKLATIIKSIGLSANETVLRAVFLVLNQVEDIEGIAVTQNAKSYLISAENIQLINMTSKFDESIIKLTIDAVGNVENTKNLKMGNNDLYQGIVDQYSAKEPAKELTFSLNGLLEAVFNKLIEMSNAENPKDEDEQFYISDEITSNIDSDQDETISSNTPLYSTNVSSQRTIHTNNDSLTNENKDLTNPGVKLTPLNANSNRSLN